MAQLFNPNKLSLSLYIHIPWCVKKCPYCDFNSHNKRGELPFDAYIQALTDDFVENYDGRPLASIFIGGGTPSLFSGKHIATLLKQIALKTPLPAEITMEVNPGTLERGAFEDYKEAGITRISLGVQSFDDEALKKIGRIHDSKAVHTAIEQLQRVFDNWNIDLMYGLPGQSLAKALTDITQAISYHPSHLSWYQLTLEPNTKFYQQPPVLPHEEILYDMFIQGQHLLEKNRYLGYEVSAFSQSKSCQHNLNYWRFGDYLGIGAGAHSKITTPEGITRLTRFRNPKDYLNQRPFISSNNKISEHQLPFEFMLNTLRLNDGFPYELFYHTTGVSDKFLTPYLQLAESKELLTWDKEWIKPTKLGKLYLNDLMALFLPDEHTSSIPNQS